MQILLLGKDENTFTVVLKFIQEFLAGILVFYIFVPQYIIIWAKLTIVDVNIVFILIHIYCNFIFINYLIYNYIKHIGMGLPFFISYIV
jgi:hypothetical protein